MSITKPYLRTSALLLTALLSLSTFYLQAQQSRRELSPGYYVVIAAYAETRENVAQNYVEILMRRGLSAGYGFDSHTRLFYLYLHYYPNLKASLQRMYQVRKDSNFSDAWVRVVPGVVTADLVHPPSTRIVDVPEEEESSKPTDKTPASTVPPKADTSMTTSSVVVASQEKSVTPSQSDSTIVTDNPPIRQFPKMTLENTEVFLSLYNATNYRIVEGTVNVMEGEDEKVLTSVAGNAYIKLPDPRNKTGTMILECDVFGYRKIRHEINYKMPLADTVQDYVDLVGTTFIVYFDLIRYRKGDIVALYQVNFYNDAAVMLPQSRPELNRLLTMLRENPKCKIMLHGHTNGNYHGKIIKAGPDRDLFSLNGAISTVGSAKDLSYSRANVIKEFLEMNGVDSSRILVKAWGGKRAIYDKHSVNARKNVRVEVEILEE